MGTFIPEEALMKSRQPNWLNYWNKSDDLDYLIKANDDIDNVYSKIKNDIGRILMSEEMIVIQESLEQRIGELQKEHSFQQ